MGKWQEAVIWRLIAPIFCGLLVTASVVVWAEFRRDDMVADMAGNWVWNWHRGLADIALASLLPVRREAFYYAICNLLLVCVLIGIIPLFWSARQFQVIEFFAPYIEYWPLAAVIGCSLCALYFLPTASEAYAIRGHWVFRKPRKPLIDEFSRRDINRCMWIGFAIWSVLMMVGNLGWALVMVPPAFMYLLFSMFPKCWGLYYFLMRGIVILWAAIALDELMAGISDAHGWVIMAWIPIFGFGLPGFLVLALLSVKPSRYSWGAEMASNETVSMK